MFRSPSRRDLQPASFGYVQATILGLPFVERRAADPMLAANIPGLRTRLMLPQDRNDPLFREPRLLHLRLPQGDGFYPFLEEGQGLRSGAPAFRPCARQWGWCRPETRERAGNRDLRKGHKSAIPSEDTLQIQDDEFHPKWNYPPVIG